jgi:hypothetical protein
MNNQFDDDYGYAICPVCCWPVRPADAVARSDEYVIHAHCAKGRPGSRSLRARRQRRDREDSRRSEAL